MIRFSIARIPIAIRPSFWIVAGLLGYGLGRPALVVIWIGIVFVSILVHELGHALVARRFGANVSIQLTTLGGLTAWSMPSSVMTPGRRALVAAAGSAVGIVGGLMVLAAYLLVRPTGAMMEFVVLNVVWVNVGWGVLNWLPIRPLDGGHLLESILEILPVRRSRQIADVIFLVTSAGAVVAGLYFDLIFVAVLAGFMTWSEISRHLRKGSGPAPSVPFVFGYDDVPDPSPPPENERIDRSGSGLETDEDASS